MSNRDDTEADLGLGTYLEGTRQKALQECYLVPVSSSTQSEQEGEERGCWGSLWIPVPPGEKPSQCAFLPKILEFLTKIFGHNYFCIDHLSGEKGKVF